MTRMRRPSRRSSPRPSRCGCPSRARRRSRAPDAAHRRLRGADEPWRLRCPPRPATRFSAAAWSAISPNCGLSSPTSGEMARFTCMPIQRRGLVALERERIGLDDAVQPLEQRGASSSVFIFWMPAPSSLGPAIGKSGNGFVGASACRFTACLGWLLHPEVRRSPKLTNRRSVHFISPFPASDSACTPDPPSPAGLPSRRTTSAVKSQRPSMDARADAVGIHGHAILLERTDARHVEPARHHDLHVAESLGVQRVAHVPHERRIHAGRPEGAHEGLHRRGLPCTRPCPAERPTGGPPARAPRRALVATESFS